MNQGEGPRVALAGIVLESNAFAPVAGEEDFRSRYYFEGESLLEAVSYTHLTLPTTSKV